MRRIYMDSIKTSLENWLNDYNNFSFKSYEELPDLDLYMEQMLGYLEKQLFLFKTSTLDKQITSSMINNYVKGSVLPAPTLKKYNKEHIALIDEIYTLKQVLTLNEIKQIEDIRYKDIVEKADTFNSFNKINSEKISIAVEDTFKRLNDIDDNDINSLVNLAQELALSANAYINIVKKILFLANVYETLNKK